MATIDYTIPGQFKGVQIEPPMNAMARAMELRGLQEASNLNALRMQEQEMKMGEAQRLNQQRNALARIHADPKVQVGSPEYLTRVQQEAPDLYEPVAARALQRAELEEKIDARKTQNFDRKFKLYQSVVPNISSEDGVYQYVQAAYNDPDLKPILEKIQPLEVALESNLSAFQQNPDDWRLRSSGVPADKLVELAMQKERAKREETRLELEDARVQETQRHQQRMEEISASGVDRQQRQLEETRRHNQAMEGLDARRVNITAAAEARKAEQGETPLSNKEIQKREAVRPQATSAIKGIEAKSESFINDLKALRDHPGLSQITGLIAGRAPAITKEGRAAQALYDKILAKGGFEMLQQMREASKTGGALGNVSNQEGKQLQASFAAIDRRQDAADVKKALDTAISDVEGARARSREAFSETYSYREQRGEGGGAEAPKLSPVDKQALDWANSNPKDPRAAQIKQRLGVK